MYEYSYPDPNLARIHDQYIDDYAEGFPDTAPQAEMDDESLDHVPPWVDDYDPPSSC